MKIFLEGNGQHIVTNDTISVNKLLKTKKFKIIDADSYLSSLNLVRQGAEAGRIQTVNKERAVSIDEANPQNR